METPLIIADHFLAGPNLWSNGPVLLARFQDGKWNPKQRRQAMQSLLAFVPEIAGCTILRRHRTLPAAAVALADVLIRAIGARWGTSRLEKDADGELRLLIVCPRRDLALTLIDGINRIFASLPDCDFSVVRDVLGLLLSVWEQPIGAALLAQEARRRKIPVIWPDEELNWMLLGQGVRGHLYQHSYLSGQSGLRDLADDKFATSHLLAKAGLPTTRPVPVGTAREAVSKALEIGMPVVLKPNSGWSQIGVWTNLCSAVEVRRAFKRATEQSGPLGPLLLERQLEGKYLRATLVAGTVKAVLTCEPPEVTGNGKHTATALAKEFYHLPAGGDFDVRSRGILEAVLSRDGLKPTDVPARGRSFRVGHDNHGHSTDVTAKIHRTLREALNRVGKLFSVPVLGVDLIVSDPFAPLDPDRDAIIDVNPAPGFAQHERTQNGQRRNLAGAILDHLFPGGATAARIPVVAGPIGCGVELERIGHWLYKRGVHPAGFTRNTSWSGIPKKKMGDGPQSASLLPLDARAEVLLIEVDEGLAGETGLPVDRIDFLIANRRTDPLTLMLARLHNSKRKGRVRVEDVLRACKTPS